MKVCYFCKGEVKKAQVRHVHRWGEHIIVFEDVQAEVCRQCGEVYLDPQVLEAIDRITAGDAQPKATMSVPVFSLAGVGSGR
jgi:YgiT-type zinc finger domain-containing protein